MKICFFIETLSKGGAERVIANLSNYLINLDEIENVDILNIYNTDVAYKLDKKINLYTIEKEYVKYEDLLNKGNIISRLIFKIKKFLKNIYRKKQVEKFYKNSNYDIIIAFLPEPSFMILSLKKKLNIPIIISERNDPNKEYNNIRANHLMRKLYPLADGIVFQTPDAKQYFDGILKSNYEIIPNPVNDLFIREPYNCEREKTIVNVGRVEGQKNQLLLIKAFEKIIDKFPEYKLFIYGDGSKKDELMKYINEKLLNNKVVLAGQVDNINEKIYKSSLFVLSSDYEGMPNALIEAMCLGLPVISTDCPCGGPKMLIKDGVNGFLVPVNDEEKLSKTIEKVLSNDKIKKEISIKASKIKEMVSSEVVNTKWLKFIQKIKEGDM